MSYCLNPSCSSPKNSSTDDCQNCGASLKLHDRYQALKPIGQGGFGRTFLAVDLFQTMKPRCIIKQLFPSQQGVELQGKASTLFRQEAEQLAALGHYRSIPNFLNYFEQDGYQYLIQEFIEGNNLAEMLKTGQIFNESEIKNLLKTLLETIDFLHDRNIIHRDIKPANIIKTNDGRFVLVDLGAAKLMTGTALGQTGTVIGSAEYVAPEQLRGKAIFASDLYSLGATCVTLLTGMSPFSLFDTSTGSWEWRDYLSTPVSDRLGKILDRMLVAPTKKRYESAELVLRELAGGTSELQEEQTIDRVLNRESTVQSKNKFDVKTASELGINTTLSGNLTTYTRPKKMSIPTFIFMGILTLAGLSQKFLTPSVPEMSEPRSPVDISLSNQLQSSPNVIDMTGVTPLGDIIKPTYNNPVKPVKVFRSIPPFKTMSLKDGGNTVVTGLLSNNGKINLNFLEIGTGKTSNINFQSELDAKADFSIHIQGDNIFLRAAGGEKGYLKKLRIFNLTNKSFIYNAAENSGFIFSDPDAETNLSNIEFAATTNLLKISGSKVSERKVEVPSAGSRSVLSSDEKSIFAWNQPSSRGEIGSPSIINWSLESGKFKSRFTIPDLISRNYNGPDLMRISQYAGNQILVASGGGISVLDAGADRKQVLDYLPDSYKNKDTQSNGKTPSGPHDGAIYVFDVTQEKLKYFIPRVGRVVGLTVSSDGKTMVTVENSNEGPSSRLMIWDLPTGRLIRSIGTHYSMNNIDIKVCFSSDNKLLIVAAPDVGFSGEKLQKSADTPDITIWKVEELRNP